MLQSIATSRGDDQHAIGVLELEGLQIKSNIFPNNVEDNFALVHLGREELEHGSKYPSEDGDNGVKELHFPNLVSHCAQTGKAAVPQASKEAKKSMYIRLVTRRRGGNNERAVEG